MLLTLSNFCIEYYLKPSWVPLRFFCFTYTKRSPDGFLILIFVAGRGHFCPKPPIPIYSKRARRWLLLCQTASSFWGKWWIFCEPRHRNSNLYFEDKRMDPFRKFIFVLSNVLLSGMAFCILLIASLLIADDDCNPNPSNDYCNSQETNPFLGNIQAYKCGHKSYNPLKKKCVDPQGVGKCRPDEGCEDCECLPAPENWRAPEDEAFLCECKIPE